MLRRVLAQLLQSWRGPATSPAGAPGAARRIAEGQQAEDEARLADALEHYQAGLAALPDSAELHTKVGNLLRALGRNAEAILAYRAALALNPDFAAAHNNLGIALFHAEELEEAMACFRRAIALDPGLATAHESLGGILFGLGRADEALACYRQLIAIEPDNGNARHLIAAICGDNPERAPDQYVARVFDGYAARFEAHLQQGLQYHTPRQLMALVREIHAQAAGHWDVLDLGCGTGLIGAELAGAARTLVGIDLSRGMLEQARAKNVYTRLEQADLERMMQGEAAASYDVIVAADVFIYTGNLDGIVAQAKRLLRPGGVFAFSVEALDAAGAAPAAQHYRLAPSGRYAHASAYLQALAALHGFAPRKLVATPLRQERDEPVMGWLALWENPGR